MKTMVDLGAGWSLLADPQGRPYLAAPNGEVGELTSGSGPLPGWVEQVQGALEKVNLEDPAGEALTAALQLWLAPGGEVWECGCGRDNPVGVARCILCGTPRGTAWTPPDNRNPRDVWREGIIRRRARFPGTWDVRLPDFSRSTAAEVDAYLEQLAQDLGGAKAPPR